jgi:hypothetical protein
MKTHANLTTTAVGISLSLVLLLASLALAVPQQKAGLPVLLTSCGQSPGPTKFDIFLKKLKLDYVYNAQATAADLSAKGKAGPPFKSIIIVTGASLKGMGAAGVSINDEISRIKALIAEAKRQNIKIIGAHIEGMARRAQGAAPGDNSDEISIDAVCPFASLLIIKKDGDEDGRFTTISKDKNIPMIPFEKNLDLETVVKDLFGK